MLRPLARAFLPAVLWAGAAAAAPEPAHPSSVADLTGWSEDDQRAALAAYRRTCRRPSRLCAAARRTALAGDGSEARRFFETWFEPVPMAAPGFLTGYFEPEVPGSLAPSTIHSAALLARPASLVNAPHPPPPGWPEGASAARRLATGLAPMPDRAAIEAGALGAEARPLVYLDPVDAFMVHVQGSARIRLGDGTVLRVGFDGKNGQPYTAIGKVLAERENLPPAEVTADRLWAWLKAHPDEAPAVMRANRSFIFFKIVGGDAREGPVGAAGVPLSAGRSLAVDHRLLAYGTPVWLDGELPGQDGAATPWRRLVVAQDTGTAIVGPARGDLFLGSGDRAGAEAARLRHRVGWVVLRPKRSVARRGRRR